MHRFLPILFILAEASEELKCNHPFEHDHQMKRCYFGRQSKVTYSEARAICESTPGGSLLSIHSDLQNEVLLETLEKDSFPFWLGLSRTNPGLRHWQWDDHSPTDYMNWAKIDDENLNVILLSNGKWTTENASALHSVFCIENLVNEGRCPEGWTFYEATNACYTVGYDMSFIQGEAFCRDYGGHLTSIHSKEENEFVYNLAYAPCVEAQGFFHEVLTGGIWDGRAGRIANWTDGSPVDFMGDICGTWGESLIKLAADDQGCGSCAPRGWLVGASHGFDEKIPRIVCKNL